MKSIIRIFILLIFCFIILNILVDQYNGELPVAEGGFTCEEFSQSDSISNKSINHQRAWKDSKYWESYCVNYAIVGDHYNSSFTYRNGLNQSFYYETFHEYWGKVYHDLLQYESDRLWALQDSLKNIGLQESLNSVDFADMVVSFVQDIPYSFIMSKSCDEAGDTPCVADQKFGLLSPVEFLYTLKGDCDTRTTVLYKLLKHFGYDVKVVISSEYAHAMLAINLPLTGDYLTYMGKRYYFWETTNIGWQPGMLDADMKNINYWNIALN